MNQLISLKLTLIAVVSLATLTAKGAETATKLQATDTAGRHSITIAAKDSPVGETVHFEYKLSGHGANCNYTYSGNARRLTVAELGKSDTDWNEFLPTGESVRYARYGIDGNKGAEFEIDVESKTPRFVSLGLAAPKGLREQKCRGVGETLEVMFFR